MASMVFKIDTNNLLAVVIPLELVYYSQHLYRYSSYTLAINNYLQASNIAESTGNRYILLCLEVLVRLSEQNTYF